MARKTTKKAGDDDVEVEERNTGEESRTMRLIHWGSSDKGELSRGQTRVKCCTSLTYCRNQLLEPEWKLNQLYRIDVI